MNEYLSVLKNYAKFDGRARRREYWMFTLVNIVIYILFTILAQHAPALGIVALIYMLAILVPSIAVGVRRMHDIGKSGWWLLISLVPIIGGIWLLVLTVTPGQSGSNAYGPDPKA